MPPRYIITITFLMPGIVRSSVSLLRRRGSLPSRLPANSLTEKFLERAAGARQCKRVSLSAASSPFREQRKRLKSVTIRAQSECRRDSRELAMFRAFQTQIMTYLKYYFHSHSCTGCARRRLLGSRAGMHVCAG